MLRMIDNSKKIEVAEAKPKDFKPEDKINRNRVKVL